MEITSTISSPEEDAQVIHDGSTSVPGYDYGDPFEEIHSFSVYDYCLFSAMLALSALIGVYFAFCAKQKQNTTSEYLMGGKTMGLGPVSMSLVASCVSGITLLGASGEMYSYGTQYSTTILGLSNACIISGLFFMPVFYKLQLNTSYEYLEVRFDRSVRLLGSILFIINSLLYIPIVVYTPALAFSQGITLLGASGEMYSYVSGINVHLITPLVCLVCIFYTSLGGLKAVVWTDALQTVMMFGGMVFVIWVGTIAVGGLSVVWERNERSDRLEFFNIDLDPTIRHTFWNTTFGSTFAWLTHLSINQAMVQRFLAMPTINKARIMIVILCFGVGIISAISFYAGLLIFASYHDCDLLETKKVKATDQILPYFVMDVAKPISGLPGLFMAGVFSAALSSMSTGLNSMAGVIYEDFIDPYLKVKLSEERASFLMKVICAIIGFVCVGMVFVVENLGAVVQVSWSLGGVTMGPMMAVFVLGMFFPWANAKGTFVGGMTGLIAMGFICFGTQAAIANGKIKFEKKPVSVEGCHFLSQSTYSTMDAVINSTDFFAPLFTEETTLSQAIPPENDDTFPIFRLSYTLYTLIGLTISIIVGLAASALTGLTDPADVHMDLLTPVLHPFFSKMCKSGDGYAAKPKKPENLEVVKEMDEIHTLLTNHNQPGNKGSIQTEE